MQPQREFDSSSNKVLWIVLGVVGGLILLCGGGVVVAIILITTLGQNANGTFEFVATKVSSGGGSSEPTRSTVEERVYAVVAEQARVPKETLARKNTLKELGAGGVNAVELAKKLEAEFSIKFPANQATRWKTIGDVLDSVHEEVKRAPIPADLLRKKDKK